MILSCGMQEIITEEIQNNDILGIIATLGPILELPLSFHLMQDRAQGILEAKPCDLGSQTLAASLGCDH